MEPSGCCTWGSLPAWSKHYIKAVAREDVGDVMSKQSCVSSKELSSGMKP